MCLNGGIKFSFAVYETVRAERGAELSINVAYRTFVSAPYASAVCSWPSCRGTCCSPAPVPPFCGRSPGARPRGRLAPPSSRRGISAARSAVAVCLQAEKRETPSGLGRFVRDERVGFQGSCEDPEETCHGLCPEIGHLWGRNGDRSSSHYMRSKFVVPAGGRQFKDETWFRVSAINTVLSKFLGVKFNSKRMKIHMKRQWKYHRLESQKRMFNSNSKWIRY